jgi:hypothetical protein
MVIEMNTTELATIGQVRQFLVGVSGVEVRVLEADGRRRRLVDHVREWFGYFGRSRADHGVLSEYIRRVSRYSRAHVIRLIAQFRETKTLGLRERGTRTQFARRYTDEDVALLAELDRLHETLSGATTRSRRRGAMVACGISPRHAKRADHFTARHVTYCS